MYLLTEYRRIFKYSITHSENCRAFRDLLVINVTDAYVDWTAKRLRHGISNLAATNGGCDQRDSCLDYQ